MAFQETVSNYSITHLKSDLVALRQIVRLTTTPWCSSWPRFASTWRIPRSLTPEPFAQRTTGHPCAALEDV